MTRPQSGSDWRNQSRENETQTVRRIEDQKHSYIQYGAFARVNASMQGLTHNLKTKWRLFNTT